MNRKLILVLVVVAVLEVAAFLVFTEWFQGESYSTSVVVKRIYRDSVLGSVTKVVYDATGSEDLSAYRADCARHGGFFEECGNICQPGATACVEVCGVTCTF